MVFVAFVSGRVVVVTRVEGFPCFLSFSVGPLASAASRYLGTCIQSVEGEGLQLQGEFGS